MITPDMRAPDRSPPHRRPVRLAWTKTGMRTTATGNEDGAIGGRHPGGQRSRDQECGRERIEPQDANAYQR